MTKAMRREPSWSGDDEQPSLDARRRSRCWRSPSPAARVGGVLRYRAASPPTRFRTGIAGSAHPSACRNHRDSDVPRSRRFGSPGSRNLFSSQPLIESFSETVRSCSRVRERIADASPTPQEEGPRAAGQPSRPRSIEAGAASNDRAPLVRPLDKTDLDMARLHFSSAANRGWATAAAPGSPTRHRTRDGIAVASARRESRSRRGPDPNNRPRPLRSRGLDRPTCRSAARLRRGSRDRYSRPRPHAGDAATPSPAPRTKGGRTRGPQHGHRFPRSPLSRLRGPAATPPVRRPSLRTLATRGRGKGLRGCVIC